jgi:hypothetical protein
LAPTNSKPVLEAGSTLLATAKAAILDGDRARALKLLDGLRGRPAEDGRQLAPRLAEALVATARGDSDSRRDAIARELHEADAALRQIVDWISRCEFDGEDLALIATAISACQARIAHRQQAGFDSAGVDNTTTRPLGRGLAGVAMD